MKDLTYTITKINPATATKATSKEVVDTKSNDEQKTKVEIDDDGFKIPQGTQHRLRKKLESAECLMIVQRILDKDLDPSGVLIDVVKVRHKLKSYGLSDREWRCYLLYHQRYATLAPIARKLIMELEPKIIEVELIWDHEKNPLEPTTQQRNVKIWPFCNISIMIMLITFIFGIPMIHHSIHIVPYLFDLDFTLTKIYDLESYHDGQVQD